jgi:hypothetical protein
MIPVPMELMRVQSPLVNPALVYPALAQLRSVDGEVMTRPRPNGFTLGAIGVTKPGALFVATGQAQRSGQREPEK